MRSLTPEAQEERRRQVIGLRESGLTYEAIGLQVGLTRNGVFDICKRFRERGMVGLQTGPRGPAPGTGRFLTAAQEATIRGLICCGTPDAYGLPFALWGRAAVAALIEQRYGVRLAVRTMGTYLARWEFTPQKPLRRAYEQQPDAVRHWLKKDYPAIQAKARRQKGTIFWGDESGLRSDGFCQNSCQTRRREVKAEFSLRRFENSEHTAGTTQVKQATAAGRDVLVVAGARAEEVAELVIAATEALR